MEHAQTGYDLCTIVEKLQSALGECKMSVKSRNQGVFVIKPSVPVLLVLFLCLFAATGLCASTLTVTKIEDTNDGACDADCSLREAVTAAASGDTVVFSSLFNSPQTITLTLGQIAIDKNLTITGTGQNLVTISGNNAGRIFFVNVSGVTLNVSSMTFRDGNVGSQGSFDAYGGAIEC